MRLELPKNPLESEVAGSKAELFTAKFKTWLQANIENIDPSKLSTEEGLKEIIANSRVLRMGVIADEVFAELQKQGFIMEQAEEVVEPSKPQEDIISFRPQRFTLITDENVYKQIAENEIFLKDIFDEEVVDIVYKVALSLEQERPIEDSGYYNAFAEAGIIRGGEKEVQRDLDLLAKYERIFRENDKLRNKENHKKIAIIIERALAYAVSKLEWYGKGFSIAYTSRFDDYVGGFDGIMQIKKDEQKDNFLGLGIDVTYSGMSSEIYKQKVFNLLDDIKSNSLNVKYFTNNQGEMMKEFSVPKIILNFSVDSVREIVKFVKGNDKPETVEKFKNSEQKITVLKQTLIACELLADFSYQYHAGISNEYDNVVTSILTLAKENDQFQSILSNRAKDPMMIKIKSIISEYQKTK